MTDTDIAWEEWGRRDPYFGVITDKKFRRADLTEESKAQFFESGRLHAEYIMQMIRQYLDPQFTPRSVLDFGCGVGRVVIPFAKSVSTAHGLDVSPSMLDEARRNCEAMGVSNVILSVSDDYLSSLAGQYDLIHSFIVFQHIPAERGRLIFRKLLSHLSPGGVGAIHFVYSKAHFAPHYGTPPRPAAPAAKPPPPPPGADPEMQMNPYSATEMLFLVQGAGVHRFHAEFTDHGGELGMFLFFQKPAASAIEPVTPAT